MQVGVRRIVTGTDATGHSVFVSDGTPEAIIGTDGEMLADLWRIDGPPHNPSAGRAPDTQRPLPPAGGTVFRLFRVMPESQERAEIEATLAAYKDRVRLDPPDENAGMRQRPTIDYITVLSGEIWLRLDSGAETHLKLGDCVILRGTRHAWRNRGAEPCLLSWVMVSTRTSQYSE